MWAELTARLRTACTISVDNNVLRDIDVFGAFTVCRALLITLPLTTAQGHVCYPHPHCTDDRTEARVLWQLGRGGARRRAPAFWMQNPF